MNTTYYVEEIGVGMKPAAPARIVCYDEGDGEWTIDAEDAEGRCIRDSHGHYPASVWHDEEGVDSFSPWTREHAVAAAVGLAVEIGNPVLPVYVCCDGEMTMEAGGAE
jgi:hypothetical protein